MTDTYCTFLVALAVEANALRTALDEAGLSRISVYTIGLRASRLGEVPPLPKHSTIVMAGLAGGLDPALAVGDVVFDGPSQTLRPGLGARQRIFTSTTMVSTVAEKAALFATGGAAAVDMEQAIVATWAAEKGHPVVGLRAISDSASDVLDPVLLTLIDDLGRPRPGAIAKALLRRPLLLFELIRLGSRSKRALRKLAAAAVELARTS